MPVPPRNVHLPKIPASWMECYARVAANLRATFPLRIGTQRNTRRASIATSVSKVGR